MTTGGWEKAAVIAQIAAAGGTFAAVGASLWIALRSTGPHLRVSVGHALIPGYGGTEEGLSIAILNTGSRSVRLTAFYWRVGSQRGRFLMHAPFNQLSAQLPITLAPGEDAMYVYAMPQFRTDAELLLWAVKQRIGVFGPPQVTFEVGTAGEYRGRERMHRNFRTWMASLAPSAPPAGWRGAK